MSMNLDIKHWFPAKNDKWIAEKRQALVYLKQALLEIHINNTEPFIRIAVQELIRQNQPVRSKDRKKKEKQTAKLKKLAKAIDALEFELRCPLGVPGMPCCEAVRVRYAPCRGKRYLKPTASS